MQADRAGGRPSITAPCELHHLGPIPDLACLTETRSSRESAI